MQSESIAPLNKLKSEIDKAIELKENLSMQMPLLDHFFAWCYMLIQVQANQKLMFLFLN